MPNKTPQILGICRFSMLGRGDWKAWRKQPETNAEAIIEETAQRLFDPTRLEARFATFEHLTLRALAAQSDPDFTFLVLSSDRMPAPWRHRLEALCASVPQVQLHFLPPIHASDAIREIAQQTDLNLPDTLQFRLDDDDCVSRDFIRRLRAISTAMWPMGNFAVSFSTQYYCVTDGPTKGIYQWHSPFFSAGATVRHRNRLVFDFGHYNIQKRMLAVTEPSYPNIVTHRGDNDTPRHPPEILRKRGMFLAPPDDLARALSRHFDYLTNEGRALCGLPAIE